MTKIIVRSTREICTGKMNKINLRTWVIPGTDVINIVVYKVCLSKAGVCIIQ